MGAPEFESGTSSLSATRSNQLSYTPEFAGCRRNRSSMPASSVTGGKHRPKSWRKANFCRGGRVILRTDARLSNGVRCHVGVRRCPPSFFPGHPRSLDFTAHDQRDSGGLEARRARDFDIGPGTSKSPSVSYSFGKVCVGDAGFAGIADAMKSLVVGDSSALACGSGGARSAFVTSGDSGIDNCSVDRRSCRRSGRHRRSK